MVHARAYWMEAEESNSSSNVLVQREKNIKQYMYFIWIMI